MILNSFGPQSPLKTPVSLTAQDTLTVSLTAKDNGKAKRPHQAFVLLKEDDTGLEAPFPLTVRDTGKGNVKIVCGKLLTLSICALDRELIVTILTDPKGPALPVLRLQQAPPCDRRHWLLRLFEWYRCRRLRYRCKAGCCRATSFRSRVPTIRQEAPDSPHLQRGD